MPANYVLLEKVTLSANAASVVLDNIPQTGYTDLKIVVSARTARASNGDYVLLSFNGAEANSARGLWGYGTTVVSDSTTNNGLIVPGNNATASTFGNLEVYCPNYTSSTNKSISIDASAEDNASASNGNKISTFLWSSGSASTSAVTSITLAGRFASFLSGSTFSLYGLAAFGTTPTVAPKATGGNIVANDGTYWYHAFLSSGNFVPQFGLTADVLVVAGGGGGGSNAGGGAGAGGLRLTTAQSLSATSYTVTVGAGGMYGATNGSTTATNGSNSSFNSYSVTGGGYGGMNGYAGSSGGSGGGGAGSGRAGGSGNAGSYSPVEGYAGGAGVSFAGGGGGGAAVAAANASGSNSASNGGAGANSYNGTTFTSWLTATGAGSSSYLAGGGGGGSEGGAGGTGGSGGGGAGGQSNGNGTAAVANTGGGGGGGSNGGAVFGGAGGSGIVIIRYAMT
jgi:hypothetical protein